MTTDERLSPTLEDMILLIVLGLLDARLPKYVKSHYALKMENSRLMDFKADIFANIIKFVDQIDTLEQFSAFKVETPDLAAFNKNCDASTNFRRNPGRARRQRQTPSASPARTATRASLSTAATVRGTRSAPARRSSTPSTATTSSRRSCKTLISLLESRRRSVQ